MGQKVNPIGIRLGIVRDWTSKWYADSKDYADLLNTDLQVRGFLKKELQKASVSRIQIDRPAKKRPHHDPYSATRSRHRQAGRGHR
jgi:small subunit ribosomal protein S3